MSCYCRCCDKGSTKVLSHSFAIVLQLWYCCAKVGLLQRKLHMSLVVRLHLCLCTQKCTETHKAQSFPFPPTAVVVETGWCRVIVVWKPGNEKLRPGSAPVEWQTHTCTPSYTHCPDCHCAVITWPHDLASILCHSRSVLLVICVKSHDSHTDTLTHTCTHPQLRASSPAPAFHPLFGLALSFFI